MISLIKRLFKVSVRLMDIVVGNTLGDVRGSHIEPCGTTVGEENIYSGDVHLRDGDYDSAIAEYTSVIRRQAECYFRRGNAYLGKDDYDLAIADYNTVLSLEPFNAAAYHNRARAYYGKGDRDMADAEYYNKIQAGGSNPNRKKDS